MINGQPLLPRSLVNPWKLAREGFQSELEATEAKLANDAAPAPGGSTPVLDRCRARVAAEGVELELRLVAHLRGEVLVARDVEVGAARDLVVGDALTRFHVAQDAYVRSGRHRELMLPSYM